MSDNPVAGWYEDPTPGSTKLRFWDGDQWTNDLEDAPVAVDAQSAQVVQDFAAEANLPAQPEIQLEAQGYVEPVAVQPVAYEQQQQQGQPYDQQQQYGQQYDQQGNQQYGQPYNQQYAQPNVQVDESKTTLKMVAFIFNLVSTISVCWLVFPLAWMIPMTLHSWNIYKGTKKNTTVFGVCCLLFVSLVSGVILLIAGED